ncbi:MAG: hypothetical protein HY547_06580 [Elusimicrobia bacterium]|nr:hypothetical protein [Elusimicrobiota bacterium]
MRRVLMAKALILALATMSWAGFQFGLGKAAAKKSADVIACAQNPKDRSCKGNSTREEPGSNWGSASSLSNCGAEAPYFAMPVALNEFQGLVPLGNLNPTGHTFPTRHHYFCNLFNATATVYFPGNVRVTSLVSSENLSSGTKDYSIYFAPCKEVGSYYFHIAALSTSLANQAGDFDNCSTYTTGGQNYRRCDKAVSIDVNAGDTAGTVKYQVCFDLGTRDSRITPLAFASPARYTASSDGLDDLHVVCAVNYFSEAVKSSLESRLGNWDGTIQRSSAPICGTSMQDVVNTAQGNWFYSEGGSGEDPHLALVHDNVLPSTAVFSVGNSMSSLASGMYQLNPSGSGLVNRDFNEVTADGNIYCYQAVNLLNSIILIQLTDNTTLKIESQSAAACGSGPWAFTSAATTFLR